MNEVKRYEMYPCDGPGVHAEFDINGQWVNYEDYAALQQKLDEVLAENARMLSDYREIPEMRRIGAPLTPATDAILNEVRAEGVEMFASYWESNCAHDDTFVGKKAKHFASKLRAGSKEGGV